MKFKVGFYYEESSVVEVEADSKEDAEAKLKTELNDYGLERRGKVNTRFKFTTAHRDFDAMDAKKKEFYTKRST